MSRKKEIEVVEVQWEQSTFHPENDRVVRKYHQFFYCFGANLLLFCFGVIFPQSGFLLPQLEDPDIGFGIDKNQGSWFGKTFFLKFEL